MVECEPDHDLCDTEQVPLLHEKSIDGFLGKEALPYVPDARYAHGSVKIGYGISLTRHLYKSQPTRPLEEKRADIMMLGRDTEGLLAGIMPMAIKS